VWETGEGDLPYEEEAMRAHAKEMVFPIGAPNDGFHSIFLAEVFLHRFPLLRLAFST